MENQILMLPANRQQDPLVDFIDAEDAVIIDEAPVQTKAYVNFLEANTNAITMEELSNTCVVPTWGNQEAPDIRVSHIVRGRIPSALHKKASELLESEKTQFYQRLAFAFTIPTIYETINGERLELCVGGVRNYSDLNLYRQGKGVEKFSVFIGWRVNICSNQVLTGQGVSLQIEVMNINDLWKQVLELIQRFDPAKDIYLMKNLANSYLTETQFAQIVGRMRLYQALPTGLQKQIPRLLITDSQINNVCRDFYGSETFGMKDNRLSMWDFHNLLTESNKSSYIDSYLQRAVNATEMSVGINNALHGDATYSWFLG